MQAVYYRARGFRRVRRDTTRSDERILAMTRVIGVTEDLLACPEGAAAFEAAYQLRQAGMIHEHEDVVVYNTGTGMKYVEHLRGRPPLPVAKDELMQRVERELEDLDGYHRPLVVERGATPHRARRTRSGTAPSQTRPLRSASVS